MNSRFHLSRLRKESAALATSLLKALNGKFTPAPSRTQELRSHLEDQYKCRYGRPGCSDEAVEEAAEASAIHDPIVNRFPKAYDTLVGMPPACHKPYTSLAQIELTCCTPLPASGLLSQFCLPKNAVAVPLQKVLKIAIGSQQAWPLVSRVNTYA